MAKKLFHSLILGVIVFSVAVLAGYLSYVITYRYQTERVKENLLSSGMAEASPVNASARPLTQEDILAVDYYIAKLENEDIAIYISTKGKEAFLYSLDIRPGDLTEEDILRLTQGMILKTRKELVSFEEDFTS